MGTVDRNRTIRLGRGSALVLAALVCCCALFAWQSTLASFTGTTKNSANATTAGSVVVTDDDGGLALFGVTGLTAGATGTKCIVVTYGGSLTSAVRVYATGYAQTSGLGRFVDLTIKEGSGSSFAGSGPTSCSGFTPSATIYTGTLDAFAAAATSYTTGVGTWAPTGSGQTKTYQLTYLLDPRAPNTVAAGTASLGFTWEARNS